MQFLLSISSMNCPSSHLFFSSAFFFPDLSWFAFLPDKSMFSTKMFWLDLTIPKDKEHTASLACLLQWLIAPTFKNMPVISVCLAATACCSFLQCVYVFLVKVKDLFATHFFLFAKSILHMVTKEPSSLLFLFFFYFINWNLYISAGHWSVLYPDCRSCLWVTSRAGVLIATNRRVLGDNISFCAQGSCLWTQVLISNVFQLVLQPWEY